MTCYRSLICDDLERRNLLVRAYALGTEINGLDYIEVSEDQLTLSLYFVNPLPADAYGLPANPGRITVSGGVRIQGIRMLSATVAGSHRVDATVNRYGDFSLYTLAVDSDSLDPAYAQGKFSFKANCPSDFDCKPAPSISVPDRPAPAIDYMAKDYASFRQLLLDMLPTLAPQWTERHAADLGMTLIELLAYAGDQLSYYQDAVATEAYLATARQRISVGRHTRLIDYTPQDGLSARTFVHFAVDEAGEIPMGSQLLTRINAPLSTEQALPGPLLAAEEMARARTLADAIFETMIPVQAHPLLNRMVIHAWGNRRCCLPMGTTTLDLVGDLAFDPAQDGPNGLRQESWRLKPGDFLLVEEIVGPQTGLTADADPTHRQILRVTQAVATQDQLMGLALTRIIWDRADALTFPLCLSATLDDGVYVEPVSVARGNLALADHGMTISGEAHAGPQPPGHGSQRRVFRLALGEGPLSQRMPLPSGATTPVSALMASAHTGAVTAVPQATLRVTPASLPPVTWTPVVPDLLRSHAFDPHFVAETDNQGRAILRFGDDEFGMAPTHGAAISATYRVGLGRAGNIGADSLAHTEQTATLPRIHAIRNPLPAWGGSEPEPMARTVGLAPAAFRAEQFRAVTEADYANAAMKHPEVSRAVATFRWTGSWHTVFLTVDPVGRTDFPPALQERIASWVQRYTLAGYDLEIDPPIFVPLEIEMSICVLPEHFRAHVAEAVFKALSNQDWPDGSRGFFHPDNATFGQPLYPSRLYAAVEAVPGVDSVEITTFRRFGKQPNPELKQGRISADRLEILRLDNDPNFPENGVLRVEMKGGK